MTRRFLDNIRADIATQLADNPTGDITAAIMQNLLLDMIDSTIQDEGAITGGSVLDIALTNAWQLLDIFDTNVGGDGDFITPSAGTGVIVTSDNAGFSYQINAQLSFVTDNNRDYEFSILQDGVEIGFLSSQTGTGAGDTQSIYLSTFVKSAPADAQYSIGARNNGTTGDLDVIASSITVIIVPTNNP